MTGFLDTGIGASDVDTGDIGHSLRFRGAQYLNRTITTDATSTYVMKVKRVKLGVVSPIIETNIRFNANDTLTAFGLTTTAVFRDPTSWIFIHISNNGLYVNGQSLGAVTTSAITNGRIGYDGTNYFDGYMARFCVVGGSASAYTNFDYLNTDTNTWVTKTQSQVKAVVDAGGTNSFMLDFDDGTSLTTLGYDKSSKGNNWTLNNFSITPGTTYDHMLDVPGNSFATLNPLNTGTAGINLTEANLKFAGSTSAGGGTNVAASGGTISARNSKWYFECLPDAMTGSQLGVGIVDVACDFRTSFWGVFTTKWWTMGGGTPASAPGFSNGDVLGIAYDADAGKIWFSKNGTWILSGDPSSGANPAGTWSGGSISVKPFVTDYNDDVNAAIANLCFGQAPLHASATYHSAAGGYFRYTPPTGFKALCQANIPTPAIIDPTDHHAVVTVTKSGNTNFTIPWDASTYDTLFKIKRRDAVGAWYWLDGLRGYDKYLSSNSTAAETTDANVLSVSTTTGTLKSTLTDGTYVVYMWKAGLTASRQTNTDGSITSTVSRNVLSGFAIVTYTGTGANATMGHGLDRAPKLILAKSRDSAIFNWGVYHASVGATQAGHINLTSAFAASSTYWQDTAPSSTVFSVGSANQMNDASDGYVAYCFAEVPGYSAFGKYTGNASTDGPYANLGFLPSYLEVKRTDSTSDYGIADVARSDINVADDLILMNTTAAESATTWLDIDALGFKIRSATQHNVTTGTYIYSAFAKTAGKFSNSR